MHDASLKNVLWTLEKKAGMVFFYSVKDIEQVAGIDVNAKNKTLSEILTQVLQDTDLTYEITHNTVVLRKKEAGVTAVPQTRQNEVTGKVVDSSGEPLPGVTVMLKGTQLGVTTDSEGNFKMTLPQSNVVLIFSFIGMETQEVTVDGKKEIGRASCRERV